VAVFEVYVERQAFGPLHDLSVFFGGTFACGVVGFNQLLGNKTLLLDDILALGGTAKRGGHLEWGSKADCEGKISIFLVLFFARYGGSSCPFYMAS
jgi:hypothetical protein